MVHTIHSRWLTLIWVLVLAAGGPPGSSVGLAQSAGPAPIDPYRTSVTIIDPSNVQIRGNPGSLTPGSSVRVTNVPSGATGSAPAASDGSFEVYLTARRNQKLSLTALDSAGNSSSPTDLYVGALIIKNPYTSGGSWFVGQAHTHTVASDGVNLPADLEAAYKDWGYDFVISTDHRGASPDYFADDDGLTPDPNNSASGKDLLWISGSELSNGSVHLGSWGETSRVPTSLLTDTQVMIDAVRARGGIAVINHPGSPDPPYGWSWPRETTVYHGYSLVEAFNAVPSRVNLVDAVDLADEFQQVWWIGADDCHDISGPNFDQYAIVVQTDQPAMSAADLIASADAGRLYIRQTRLGPEIEGVMVSGNRITVSLKYIPSTYDVTWIGRGNVVLQTSAGARTQSSYTVKGGEGYVRAEIHRDSDGTLAYTQPLFVANAPDLAASASAPALVDNNSTTAWDAGAATGSFVVDAGSVRPLNALHIDWDGTGGRRFNYRIETSGTGQFSGEQKEVVRTTHSNRSANTVDFFDEQARYVRVVITGQSAGPAATARVREVELHDASPARTQLYVNNVAGSDSNSGTASSPWETAAYAATRVRPRDTLNFVRTGVPYPGMLEITSEQSGKNSSATVEYRGDPDLLTPISAAGSEWGVRFTDTQYLEMTHFAIYGGTNRNLWLANTRAGTSVRYSRIHNSVAVGSEGVLGSGKFSLAYNLIYNNGGEGIVVSGDGTDATIDNNVISSNGNAGLVVGSGTISATIRNNIISGNGAYEAMENRSFGVVADSHNCVSGHILGPWLETGNVAGDPRLTNPAAGDMTLQASSPCIDAGVDLNFNSDFIGYGMFDEPSRPNTGSAGDYSRDFIDMGAYEFGSPCPDCGGGGCHN